MTLLDAGLQALGAAVSFGRQQVSGPAAVGYFARQPAIMQATTHAARAAEDAPEDNGGYGKTGEMRG